MSSHCRILKNNYSTHTHTHTQIHKHTHTQIKGVLLLSDYSETPGGEQGDCVDFPSSVAEGYWIRIHRYAWYCLQDNMVNMSPPSVPVFSSSLQCLSRDDLRTLTYGIPLGQLRGIKRRASPCLFIIVPSYWWRSN